MTDPTEGTNGAGAAGGGLRLNESVLMARQLASSLAGLQFGGARDLYTTYGYNPQPTVEDFFTRYRRQDVAGRIIDMPPEDCWRNPPQISDDDQPETTSAFEKAWEDLAKRLGVWSVLERADKLTGLGRFGVVLIGARGSAAGLSAEMPELNGPDDVLYLQPYSERLVRVRDFVTDPADPRFGLVKSYAIDLGAPSEVSGTSTSRASQTATVHWSRVVHVAEPLEDRVFGAPRLERVYNLLDDLAKTVGGSAEMFFRGAWGGKQLDMDPEVDLTPEDQTKLEQRVDEWQHDLRRVLQTRGITVRDLTGQIADPRGVVSVLMDLLAGATGIPQRMLMGSERGQLASQEDQVSHRSKMRNRQLHFCEPIVLRPLVDRLIDYGGLPAPQNGTWQARWPPISELTVRERAQTFALLARGARDFAQAGGRNPLAAEDMRETLQLKRELPPGDADQLPPPVAGGGPALSGDRDADGATGSAEANV